MLSFPLLSRTSNPTLSPHCVCVCAWFGLRTFALFPTRGKQVEYKIEIEDLQDAGEAGAGGDSASVTVAPDAAPAASPRGSTSKVKKTTML